VTSTAVQVASAKGIAPGCQARRVGGRLRVGFVYGGSKIRGGTASPVPVDSVRESHFAVRRLFGYYLLPARPVSDRHDGFLEPEVRRCIRPIDIHSFRRRSADDEGCLLNNGLFVSVPSLADFPYVSDHSACMIFSTFWYHRRYICLPQTSTSSHFTLDAF